MPRNFTDRDLAIIRNRMGESIPVPPAPKRRNNEESRIQQALILWWSVACKAHGLPEFVLFAIPNGHKRGAVVGAILKREGVRSGVSDLFLMVPRDRYHGLFLELKTETGTPSAAQTTFITEAAKQGYAAGCAYGTKDAVRYIEAYLRGEIFF